MQRQITRDASTGREVWQVTDGEWECVAPYMDVRAWTRDDRYLIFTCNRTGSWQPYRLELESGEATQLGEFHGGFRSIALDPAHDIVYCQDTDRILAVDLETLESRIAVDYSCWMGKVRDFGGGKGRSPSLNHDGTLVAACAQDAQGRSVILFAPTDGSNLFEVVPLEREGLIPDHVLFCPGDDNVVAFVVSPDRQNNPLETPDNRTCGWRMERSSGRMKPLVLVPPGFRATHCTWGNSGGRHYFHRKSVPGWVPTALCSVNREGEDLQVHFETSEWRLGHSASSPDEDWLVTDSQDPDLNILLLAHTRRDEQHMLCWPNMSIKGSTRPHRRHPDLPPHTDVDTHPGFSTTGKYVHYTSDISGRSQVYVVPVNDLVHS